MTFTIAHHVNCTHSLCLNWVAICWGLIFTNDPTSNWLRQPYDSPGDSKATVKSRCYLVIYRNTCMSCKNIASIQSNQNKRNPCAYFMGSIIHKWLRRCLPGSDTCAQLGGSTEHDTNKVKVLFMFYLSCPRIVCTEYRVMTFRGV